MKSHLKKTYYCILLFVIAFGYSEKGFAQPEFRWDLELDVSIPFNVEGNEEAIRAYYGEYVPIIIELKNCGPRLYDSPFLLIGAKIKLTVQGLELPASNVGYGHAPWYYNADDQSVRFGNVDNYCGPILNTYISGPTIMAKVIDSENAYLTAEIVEYTHDGSYGLERSNLASYEIDSQPNNGVDTDGDGDFSNDPDDEDDGDGLYLTDINTRKPISCECEDTVSAPPVSPVPITSAGCLGPIDQLSSMASNPENDVNGIFNFDYRIRANIEINADYDGVLKNRSYDADFYVNTADGSAFFPKGFFTTNFGSDSWMDREMYGSIRRSNGQMVSYVHDKRPEVNMKRAITVNMDQTSADVVGGQFAFINQFMEGISTATSTPTPIPVDLSWGDTEGFVSDIEQADGTTGKITIYFDREINMPPIHTNVPLVGFLVGVLKDNVNRNCNRLAVFTKMETEGSGEYLQAKLLSITPEKITFNGAGFEKMTLAAGNVATIAAMTQEEQDDMIASQQNYSARIQAKIAEIAACGTDKVCIAEKTREMQVLVKEKQDVMYDLMTDTSGAGGAGGTGSDQLNAQRAIRDQMFVLADQMNTKELECEDLLQRAKDVCETYRDDPRRCENAGRLVTQCRAEYDALKIEVKRLECEMAKLQGTQDMLEDCH